MRKNIRVYKGIIFDPAKMMWCGWKSTHASAASAIEWSPNGLTDDDHAALMDLKKTPYEPTPKLEDVLESAYTEWNACRNTGVTMFSSLFQFTARRIRSVFPHIDNEDA
jgi:hypothetical protein